MVKADSYIVPNPDEQRKHQNRPKSGQQEPLSGSKKRNSKIIRDIITIRKADYS